MSKNRKRPKMNEELTVEKLREIKVLLEEADKKTPRVKVDGVDYIVIK